MRKKLPIPENWQDFEDVCLSLWKQIWRDPNAQKNGRRGQAQNGVDIFGQPWAKHGNWHGVQCKNDKRRITEKLIKSEILKAEDFEPTLSEWTLATTQQRDSNTQAIVRHLIMGKDSPFKLSIWSWDDISDEIYEQPSLLSRYFGDTFQSNPSGPLETIISNESPIERLITYFHRQSVSSLLPQNLKLALPQVILEIAQNAFEHGAATKLQAIISDKELIIKDDGTSFNPLSYVIPSQTLALNRGIGLSILIQLLKDGPSGITAEWQKQTSEGNILIFRWIADTGSGIYRIPPEDYAVLSRGQAFTHGRILQMPNDTNTIIVDCRNQMFALSPLHQLVIELLQRLPADGSLVFMFSEDFKFAENFRELDPRIIIQISN